VANRLILAQPLAARIDTLSVTCALLRRWLECGVKRDFRCTTARVRRGTRAVRVPTYLWGGHRRLYVASPVAFIRRTRDRGRDRAREPRYREGKRGGGPWERRAGTGRARRGRTRSLRTPWAHRRGSTCGLTARRASAPRSLTQIREYRKEISRSRTDSDL
jgi:hypothetical protein